MIGLKLFSLAAGAALLVAATPADARINKRQANQQTRISKGVANGNVTAREANLLQRQQGRIATYEARSRTDGPGLTRAERARLNKMQNRASKNIRRQRHDRQR